MKFVNYLLDGFMHWLYLLFRMLNFKDNIFMWIVIIGILILSIRDTKMRTSINIFLKSILKISKKGAGIIFLILYLSYCAYVILIFQSVSPPFIIALLWVLGRSMVKTHLSLFPSYGDGIIGMIKATSVPVILLFSQQITLMFEKNIFNNVLLISLSLLYIPLYSILYFLFKHTINSDSIYIKYKHRLKFDGYYFMKIFNTSLINCKYYKTNRAVLEKFLDVYGHLHFDEMQKELYKQLPYLIDKYSNNKITNKKAILSKSRKKFEVVWVLNLLFAIEIVFKVRFYDAEFSLLIYLCLFILFIYFWIDLMKLRNIKNKVDFIIYGSIYIILIFIIGIYFRNLNAFRLSEIGFLIPLFLFLHCLCFNKKFPNFIYIPYITDDNFFEISAEQYNNVRNN